MREKLERFWDAILQTIAAIIMFTLIMFLMWLAYYVQYLIHLTY